MKSLWPQDLEGGWNRRAFLAAAAGATLVPEALLAAARSAASRGPAGDAIAREKRRMLQLSGYAIDAETPLDALTTYITPNDLFFVRHHWNPMYPGVRTWTLAVDGEVGNPLSLTLADLRRMPKTTVTCVLQCAGNGRALHRPIVPGVQWKYGAVGNARWSGVRVAEILRRAGLKASGKHLHAFGSDKPPGKVPPFHRSLEMEKATTDAIVAYEMNGAPLPQLHGAPARLVVPGWAGDHWMKWVVRLSPQADPQKGFYMDTAYRYPNEPGEPGVAFKPDQMHPVTELFVKSNITQAPASVKLGGVATIRGLAFSGAPDIAMVHVTDDGGATWQEAELDSQHDAYAWRLWSFRWKPKAAGVATLAARATDSRGSVQPKEAVWNQSGYLYNGWHSVAVEVTG
jgi:sulfite oxidase